ncbi:MAG: endonuclease/exonuclease/phosphatase family protein [Hyphomonadaceae bacterium]
MRDSSKLVFWIGALAIAGVTALGLADRLQMDGAIGWAFDLLSHWPRHLFVVGMLIGALAAWRRAMAPAGILLGAAVVNLAILVGGGEFAQPQPAPPGASMIRVVSANVHGSMEAFQTLVAEAKDYGADIVSVYEAPDELEDADIAGLFPAMARRSLPSVRLEGWPLKRRSMLVADGEGEILVTRFLESNGVIIRAQKNGVQIVTTHPPSPGGPDEKWDRDRQLASIGEGLDTSLPFIIMGDFNTTPWGHAYASAPGTRAGDPRFEGTFPSFAGVLGLPIDHVRFGGGLVLTNYHVGQNIGSDHLPLFATFALPQR